MHINANSQMIVYAMQEAEFQGECLVTDPCYLIRDNAWSDLCNAEFSREGRQLELSEQCVVLYRGVKFLISSTAWGDGSYSVIGAGQFGVDSGSMCIVELASFTNAFPEHDIPENGLSTQLELNGKVRVVGMGKFEYEGSILVDTSAYDEEEE